MSIREKLILLTIKDIRDEFLKLNRETKEKDILSLKFTSYLDNLRNEVEDIIKEVGSNGN